MPNVVNKNRETSAEKKSPAWHCLVKIQVMFCIATTVTIVLTPHRQIVAVEAFSNQQETQEAVNQQLRPSVPGNVASDSKVSQQADSKKQDVEKVSKKRQEELAAFVKEHHPELVQLLQHLKKNRKPEFQAAMVDLDRAEKRITLHKDRNPERYLIELNLWKSRSRIRMLMAQLAVQDNPKIQAGLKREVARFFKCREQQLLNDKQRLQDRLQNVNESLKKISDEREDLVERQFQSYLRNAQRQRKQNENDKNPASDKKNAGQSKKGSSRQQKVANQKKGDKTSENDKSLPK